MPKNRFFDPRFKWPAILTAGVLLLPTPSAAMRNIQPANNTGLEAQIALELRAGLESPAPAPEVFFDVQSKTDRLQTLLEGIKQRTGYDVSDPANSIRLIQDTAWYGRSWFDNGRVSVIPLFPDSADRTRKLVVSYKHGHWDTYEADRVSAYPGSASPELRREWETPDGTFGGRFSHWDVPVKVTYQLNQEVLARQVRISLDSDANEGLLMGR
jgi:hypothetical protein